MALKKELDRGFGIKYSANTKRIINPDGTFNVLRHNREFSTRDLYQFLINIPWSYFLILVILFYGFLNLLFRNGLAVDNGQGFRLALGAGDECQDEYTGGKTPLMQFGIHAVTPKLLADFDAIAGFQFLHGVADYNRLVPG